MHDIEDNALAFVHSLTADQQQGLADFAALLYEAGYDHGIGIGNMLADTCWSDADRQYLRRLIEAAAEQRWERLSKACGVSPNGV